MMNKILYLILTAALGFVVTACGGGSGNRGDSDSVGADSIPEAVKDLITAVRDNDSARFASMVSYPLVRPYPLRDINTEEQMRAYYPTLVDDSLRKMIIGSPYADWSSLGWRGWTLDKGEYLWIDEQLYTVPYLSHLEKIHRAELEKREIESLPSRYRKGWSPIGCMRSVTSTAVYRLDRNPKAHAGKDYRMMVWADSTQIDRDPTAVFIGRCNVEGTADVRTYFFASPNGAKAVYMGDVNSPDDQPRVLFTDPDGVNHTDTVTSAYWLELLKSREQLTDSVASQVK